MPEPWLRMTGDGFSEFGGQVDGWDYVSDVRLTRTLTLDVKGILDDCALPEGSPLRVSVRSCPSTSLIRTLEVQVAVRNGDREAIALEVTVSGRNLSGSLQVETLVELAVDRQDAEPFTVNRAGSILWRDEVVALLDGDSGLLPVAPVPFSSLALPRSAAWYISLATGRWDWTAMGSLLVLLNTDNPAVAGALPDPHTGRTSPDAATIFDTLEVDFLTDLVGRALDDEGFHELYVVGDGEDPPQDDYSLGSLVRALVRTRLARTRETVDEAILRLRDLRAQDASMFRAEVQHSLGYPRSKAT